MENLPLSLPIAMALVTFLTVWIFYRASRSRTALGLLLAWLVVQTILGLSGFFTVTDTIPPRFTGTLLPPILVIAVLFATRRGRRFVDGLDRSVLTWLHTVRIPIEIALFVLFLHKTVPELMTFEGRNFDVLSGLSAPVVYFFVFVKKKLSNSFLLAWNLACLGLLVNIVALAVLSAPFPFQRLGFDQPNIAVLYFPYNWLPACVVPLVLLSHLAVIRQVLVRKKATPALRLA